MADLSEIMGQIPDEKLAEIVGHLSEGVDAGKVVEVLASAGVEIGEDDADAILHSLMSEGDECSGRLDAELEKVAGGLWGLRMMRLVCDTCER